MNSKYLFFYLIVLLVSSCNKGHDNINSADKIYKTELKILSDTLSINDSIEIKFISTLP